MVPSCDAGRATRSSPQQPRDHGGRGGGGTHRDPLTSILDPEAVLLSAFSTVSIKHETVNTPLESRPVLEVCARLGAQRSVLGMFEVSGAKLPCALV